MTLIICFVLFLILALVHLGLWRHRLGKLECAGAVVVSSLLMLPLLKFVYWAEVRCQAPQGFQHRVVLRRDGPLPPLAQGQVQSDADGIALSFSLKTRQQADFVELVLSEPIQFRRWAEGAPQALRAGQRLYVPDNYLAAADQPAQQAMQAGQVTLWRVPVFERSAEDQFAPLGEVSGRFQLPASSRLKPAAFRFMRGGVGAARSSVKTRYSRFNHERLLEAVFQQAGPARFYDHFRARQDACVPAWMAD